MADHFAAFSFVDRIVEFESGTRAQGEFAVPPNIAAFPSCLVAEAVGQLAAWVAMDKVAFRGRPVAALANQTRFHGTVKPGDRLDLRVEIEHCDDDAVTYAGWASVRGQRVIELQDCLGPMLPVEQFDSPVALAERLALLRGAGATPGRFRGIVPPRLMAGPGVAGESISSTLQVPELTASEAAFFADHFPRRPVFPATLLLDAQIGMALQLVAPNAMPACMTHVKMRAFIAPGDVLQLDARRAPGDENRLLLSARDAHGKTIATARLEVTSGESA